MVWTLLFFNIEIDFYNYIFTVIFRVIILGVNGPLLSLLCETLYPAGDLPVAMNPPKQSHKNHIMLMLFLETRGPFCSSRMFGCVMCACARVLHSYFGLLS